VRISLLALFLSTSCNTATPEAPAPGTLAATGETLVTVDGHAVTQGMVDAMLKRLPDQIRKQLEQTGQLGQLKDQMVVGELLYQAALTNGLHQTEDIKTALALSARETLAQAQIEAIIEARATDAAVEKWYQDHLVQFSRPQVKASHILVQDEAVIKEAHTKLLAGEDFGALARTYSKDPGSAPKGGSLGWFKKTDMVKKFANVAFTTEKGQASAPFKTRFGWHIVRVDDTRTAQPLDEVRDQIVEAMSKEIASTYIDELKAGAQIEDAATTASAGTAAGANL